MRTKDEKKKSKRGRTRATESRLALVLNLIGTLSKSREFFLANHKTKWNKKRATPDYFRHSIENGSNVLL